MTSGPGRKQRFYPTSEQEAFLVCELGVSRWVWNWLVGGFHHRRAVRLPEPPLAQLEAEFRVLRDSEHGAWLKEAAAVPIQQEFRNFESVRNKAMNGEIGWPGFRAKKYTEAGLRYVGGAFTYKDGAFSLSKVPGALELRWSYEKPEIKPSSVVIKRSRTGAWTLSYVDPDPQPEKVTFKNEAVAHDLGVKSLATSSTGDVVENPRFYYEEETKLKALRRQLSKRKKGGENWKKTKEEIARVEARVARRRLDYIHKLTSRWVRENQVNIIEDLNVLGMVASAKGTVENPGKNVKQKTGLNKAILDCGFGMIAEQLAYKSEWVGGTLILVDQWFASSKLCSKCGKKNKDLTLKDRTWVCLNCGATHERDYNAATNLLIEGVRILASKSGLDQKKYKILYDEARRSATL